MINKNGYTIILYNGLLLAGFVLLLIFYPSNLLKILLAIASVFFVFHFFFFRDPERKIPERKKVVISPADGKIIKISEVEENNYLHGKALMVSIFMSIFNVHVNRIPVSGKVEYLEHKAGKFKAAYKDKSSELNEQSLIGIKTSQDKIFFKQIAGFIARRIVNNLKIGDEVQCGERFGMIKYGSRLDVFLPLSTKINVQINERVKAGETIIGEL
jgi:phosphatidylserine decarboxylase